MTRTMPNAVPATPADETCLGRTCLKWHADGELSRLDVQLVMQRLRRAEAEAWALLDPALRDGEGGVDSR
jgi:hypothetical protein